MLEKAKKYFSSIVAAYILFGLAYQFRLLQPWKKAYPTIEKEVNERYAGKDEKKEKEAGKWLITRVIEFWKARVYVRTKREWRAGEYSYIVKYRLTDLRRYWYFNKSRDFASRVYCTRARIRFIAFEGFVFLRSFFFL